jgi:hypothetical protein
MIYFKMYLPRVHLEVVQRVVVLDPEDLFNLDKKHPKWQLIDASIKQTFFGLAQINDWYELLRT